MVLAVTGAGSQPAVTTSSLTKRYGSVTALDAISVDIPAGIVGLVGPNGAGKSTLMKILLGLADPTSGTASVLGHDVATEGIAIRERIGYMPENDCLPTDQSATQFVIHMARMSGLPAAAARERSAEILRHVGLFEERYRHIGGYSTGMKQRVKLAQALVHDPDLLFLDEPTNGLDPDGRDDMLALIGRSGNELGMSIIMSSHLLSEIEAVCDSLVLVDHGKLAGGGSMSGLTSMTSVLAVEVDGNSQPLLERLRQHGVNAEIDGRMVAIDLAHHDSSQQQALTALVLASVADLGLGLVSLGRKRHSLKELFATQEAGAAQ